VSKAPWFKLWAADFLSDNYVDAMTAEQIGWYCILLIRSWNSTPKGYLANDKQLLSKWCRDADPMSFEHRAQIVLDRFQTTEDGAFIYHPRIIEQVLSAAQVSEKRAEAGKRGGSKQKPSNCLANASHSDSDTDLVIVSSQPTFSLPVWIPEKAWNDFQLMRTKMRKPMTLKAKELAVRELEKLMNTGHDPESVLNQSIMRCWAGLFPVENSHGTNRQNQPIRVSAQSARVARNDEIFANVLRERHGDSVLGEAGGSAEQRGNAGGGHGPLVAAEPVVLPPERNQ
jgi:uncharacterized protein YdaU (DUF1376 family)